MRTFAVKAYLKVLLIGALLSGCTNGVPVTTFIQAINPSVFGVAVSGPSISNIRFASTVTFDVGYVLAANITLAAGDISVNTTGGVVCAAPVVSGAGLFLRTVTLNNCSGNGTVGITVGANTATDALLNSAPASSASPTANVDNINPSLAISAPSIGTINSAGSTDFTITYTGADSVTLATGDISLNATGGVVCSKMVSGSGNITRIVTISSCTGNGTIGISIAANTATDLAGNTSPAAGPSGVATVNNVGPNLSISAASSTLVNTTGVVTYTLTYTGATAVTLNLGDVSLVASGTSCNIQSVTPGNPTSTVILDNCTGDGTMGISVAANSANDGVNPSNAAASTSFAVDNTSPGISIGTPSLSLANNSSTATYVVTYTGYSAITLAPGDVSLNQAGGTSCTVGVTGAGATRNVNLTGCTGDGTMGISIAAGTANDNAGNLAPADGPSGLFNIDNTAPTVSVSAPSTSLVNGSSSVTYNVDFIGSTGASFSVGDVTLNPSGTSCSKAVSGSHPNYIVTLSACTGNGTMGITIEAGAATDGVNLTAASSPSSIFFIDTLAPSVSYTSGPSTAQINGSGSTDFVITYAGYNTISLTNADVGFSGTGTASCSTFNTNCIGANCTVTLSGCTGDGTVTMNLAPNTAQDAAGNNANSLGNSASFIVDNTAPTVGIGSSSVNYANTSATVDFNISYTGADFVNLLPANVSITGASSGCVANVSGAGTTSRLVSISGCTGDGNVWVSINSGTATDLAGNPAGVSGSSGFVVDNTLPTFMGYQVPTVDTPISVNNYTFAWNTFNDVNGMATNAYVIEKYSSSNCGGGASYTTAQSANNYNWSGLTDGVYSVKIQGIDAAGNVTTSPCSSNITVTLAVMRGAFTTSTCVLAAGTGGGTFGGCSNSSIGYYTSGLNGAFGTDQLCQARAAAASLPNASNYVAWASSSTDDAYCRVLGFTGKKSSNCGQGSLPTGGGPWHLPMGGGLLDPAALVSSNITQLTSCTPPTGWGNLGSYTPCLNMPIGRDEFGAGHGPFVHTNTNADGTDAGYGYWWSDSGELVGNSGQTDLDWTSVFFGGGGSFDRYMVCFEKSPANPFGQAMSFNGTDSYFKFNTTIWFNATYPLTAEAFFNTQGSASDQIIYQSWGGMPAHQLAITSTNHVRFKVIGAPGCGGSGSLTSIGTVSNNTTHHVAGVWDSSNQMKIYIDGVLDPASGSGPGSGCPSGTGDHMLGANHSYTENFNGRIDEVRLSHSVRYSSNFPVPTAPFTFDGTSLVIMHLHDTSGTSTEGSGAPINTITPYNITIVPTFIP